MGLDNYSHLPGRMPPNVAAGEVVAKFPCPRPDATTSVALAARYGRTRTGPARRSSTRLARFLLAAFPPCPLGPLLANDPRSERLDSPPIWPGSVSRRGNRLRRWQQRPAHHVI